MDIMKWLWCMIAHRKHTGERDIYSVSIVYIIKCSKCGIEDRETVWCL